MNELRKDCLLDRWVLITENRGKRPHDFIQKECKTKEGTCVFCSGNEKLTPPEIARIGGPKGWEVRCFENMYPATSVNFPQAFGKHEVVVETNQHGKHLQELSVESIRKVLDMYCIRIEEISRIEGIKYVLVFKNHGEEAGTSVAHEHSQIIALPQIPKLVEDEIAAYKHYSEKSKKCIFCDIISMEMSSERKIFESDKFACFAPFASRFPFEAWLLPKRHVKNITELTDDEKNSLADALKTILGKLGKLLSNPPYNYYLHISPDADFHFHIEICPRVTKLAGFELGSDIIINTMPPERAASELRAPSL
jgi:UDPglucose--hexose-1-phosphate uridylyltransferase